MEPLGPAKLTIPYYGASIEIIDEISFELAIKMMDSIKQRLEIAEDVKADNEEQLRFLDKINKFAQQFEKDPVGKEFIRSLRDYLKNDQ